MHFIADELVKRGTTRFFSLRYSNLSRHTNDPRLVLDSVANQLAFHDGVECYLWKTTIHPFNTRRRMLRFFEDVMFRRTMARPPKVLMRWMREADVIFFESGSAILHVELAERLNPTAKRIYIASDDLDSINVASFVKRTFAHVAPRMTALCLPSPRLAEAMPSGSRSFFVPHGLDSSIGSRVGKNPYRGKQNVVSVGSMLFDRTFFEDAASAMPDVQFHVIGSGDQRGGFPSNVQVHDEMAHDDTLAYIRFADVGVAPYRAGEVPSYLTETSMKLMQYAYFGVPPFCPARVAGDYPWRFGYEPGARDSIVRSLRLALDAPSFFPPEMLSWAEVTDRLINPAHFADTQLDVHSRL